MTTAQVRKNIKLSNDFSGYMIRHINKFKHVVRNASIVVIPENDKKLKEENEKLLEKMKRRKHLYVATQLKDGWTVSKFKK
ncbi:hypothetical protein KJ885_04800 [Patescibacteria group bacterium]|nr:hypothetical protein [Patescibacteria group bacterium]